MLPTKFQFIWLRGFQRRRLKCEKLTDDGRQVMAKAHFTFQGLWQGELKRRQYEVATSNMYFLANFGYVFP